MPVTADDFDSSDLCAGLKADSRAAFEEIYQRWSGLIYGLALRSLGNHHDAEEVTQQTFISAWRSRRTLRPSPAALPAWIVGIAKHRIAEAKAQRGRHLHETVEGVDPPQQTQDIAERLMLRDALDELGPPRSVIITMALVEQRTHPDIAATLDLPLGTVKSHIRRGLVQLRDQLKEVH